MATDRDGDLVAVNGATLAPIVARALGCAAVQLLAWRWTPLGGFEGRVAGAPVVAFSVAHSLLLTNDSSNDPLMKRSRR